MFGQFKEKIHSVQLDLNAGLKSLSEKAKEVGRSKKLPGDFHVLDSKTADLSCLKPECVDAGDEILNRFQQMWTQLHINIEFSAEKAVKSDKVILELVEHHDKQLQGWKQLHTRLQEMPVMVTQIQTLAVTLGWKQLQTRLQEMPVMGTQIQTLAVTLGKLEANFEEIESMLKSLEDTCEEEELLGNKKIQVAELVKYKELKSKERQQRRGRLLDEYNQKFRRVEDKEDAKKKERQKAFQDVFAADMAHYRTHGKMSAQVTPSSQELENQLDDFELAIGRDDQQALDDFLGPDDDDDYDGDRSSDGQSPARKKNASSRKQHVEKNESDEDDDDQDDDQDNDPEEENQSSHKTLKDAASADKLERMEDGQSDEEEKQKEETGGIDSLHILDAEAKDKVDLNQDQTLDQDHVEQSGEDSSEISSSKQQSQDDQATKDGESLKEEDDDDDDDDDFGTPDEDGDESSPKL